MKRSNFLLITILLTFPFPSFSQYTKADSGWVSLYNGTDFEGLYIRISRRLKNPATQNSYVAENGTIRYTGSGTGHVATKKSYTYYQVRVQYQFNSNLNAPYNAGLLYHIADGDFDENFNWESSSPVGYLAGAFVNSIEFQMYNGGGSSGWGGPHAGAFLGIMNVWGNSTVNRSDNCRYDEAGENFDIVTGGLTCTRRVAPLQDGALDDQGGWVEAQLNSVGDSVEHLVQGKVVARIWNLTFNDGTNEGSGPKNPMVGGHIGLQAEGAGITYRNFELRQLDSSGFPIIPGCTDSLAPNFKDIATKDDGSCQTVKIQAGLNPQGKFGITASLNPGNLVIHYKIPVLETHAFLKIYSMTGNILEKIPVTSLEGKIQLKNNDFPQGPVFFKLVSGKQQFIAKGTLLN